MLGLVVMLLVAVTPAGTEAAQADNVPLVLNAVIDTPITSASRDFLIAAIARAEQVNASALVVQLDTPGGLMEATREMVRAIVNAKTPVVIYIAPRGSRAASAGVFLTLAAHVAAMAPNTHLGAAHPVGMFGGDVQGKMGDKLENDTAAWARTLAQNRGRNADWAEKAVRESVSATATDALAQKIVDLIADDVPNLLERIDGRKVALGTGTVTLNTKGARLEIFTMSGPQTLMSRIANPDLLYFVLLLGIFLVFLEFKNPGMIAPGVVGVLLVALVLGVQVLPINWFGALLILGAAALFVAEIYVTSFGLLAVGGVVCLLFGSYLLFDVPESTLHISTAVIWSVALSFAALFVGIGTLLVRAKRQGATSNVDGMIGELGEVYERIEPGTPGKVRLRGAYWTAQADEALRPGERVKVIGLDGLKATVVRSQP